MDPMVVVGVCVLFLLGSPFPGAPFRFLLATPLVVLLAVFDSMPRVPEAKIRCVVMGVPTTSHLARNDLFIAFVSGATIGTILLSSSDTATTARAATAARTRFLSLSFGR